MARWEVDIPYAFMDQLTRLANDSSEIMEGVLNAGMDVLEPALEDSLKLATGRQTKERKRARVNGVLSGISRLKPGKGKDGVWRQRISFKGVMKYTAKKGASKGKQVTVRDNEIAAVLEYGKREADQDATHFISNAVATAEGKAIQAMREEFNRHLQ